MCRRSALVSPYTPPRVGVRGQRSETAASMTAANSTTGSQPSSMKRLADR